MPPLPERSDSPSQLQMVVDGLGDVPSPPLPPDGYRLRHYQPGDESGWAALMNHCVGSGWTAERCLAELVWRPEFHAEGCFVALRGDSLVGSATGWCEVPGPLTTGYVHMVGVHPEHRGQGLGLVVAAAALHWLAAAGCRRALLLTDDWRLPAIHQYLKLGFEPVLFDDEHRRRWSRVYSLLGRPPFTD